MARKLIAPRRDEVFSNSGVGTTRMMEYLEDNTEQTNETTDDIGSDQSNLTLSSSQISRVNKRIDQLEALLINGQNGNLNKRVSQLEHTLTAPFYKTQYNSWSYYLFLSCWL